MLLYFCCLLVIRFSDIQLFLRKIIRYPLSRLQDFTIRSSLLSKDAVVMINNLSKLCLWRLFAVRIGNVKSIFNILAITVGKDR